MRLGADPEVFLVDSSGKFISAIGKVGGSKECPRQCDDLPHGFTLQEDNVALEFGIPPASSADEFVHHIKTVLHNGLSTLPGLQFSKLSCTIFPEDQMKDPQAYIFGCEPDFNAWTKEVNDKPDPPHPWMRSAGGHVHIETKLDRFEVAKACDLFLGVPSVLMDTGEARKKLYGRAGACRLKPYGVEYRTLSNFWIFDDELIKWVWRNSEKALECVKALDWAGEVWDDDLCTSIQSCINNNDKDLAKKLVKELDLEVLC